MLVSLCPTLVSGNSKLIVWFYPEHDNTTPVTSMSCNALGFVPSMNPFPFAMSRGQDDADDSPPTGSDRSTASHGDLPYRVELWNEERSVVEQVLAVTAHSSIGYAAYHAATREYPDRYVTLRHRNRILSRWNASH